MKCALAEKNMHVSGACRLLDLRIASTTRKGVQCSLLISVLGNLYDALEPVLLTAGVQIDLVLGSSSVQVWQLLPSASEQDSSTLQCLCSNINIDSNSPEILADHGVHKRYSHNSDSKIA